MNNKAQMDTIILNSPYQGGWYIFTNHQEIIITNMDGSTRIAYEGDVVWQKNDPNLI
jgi:hypothetical protein